MWRPGRADRVGLLATYALAVALRLPAWQSNFWIDEAAVYHAAATIGGGLGHVYYEESTVPAAFSTRWLFLQRPVHSLLLWPAAAISADAFRLWFILLASALPALSAALLRAQSVRPALSYAVGVLLAALPLYVVFGVYAVPDSIMLVFVVAALLAREMGSGTLFGALLLAAVWTKEFAYILVVALLAPVLVRVARNWASSDRLEFKRPELAILLVAIAAPWPLLLALAQGATFPGWFRGGSLDLILDRSFLVPWLAVPVVAGLAFHRTRTAAALGLTYPVFFLAYHAADRGVAHSYFLASGLLGMLAAGLLLDELWTRFGPHPRGRYALGIATMLLFASLAVIPLAAEHDPVKRAVTSPFSGEPSPSLGRTYRLLETQAHGLNAAFEAAERTGATRLFLIDSAWHDPYHPGLAWAATLRLGFPHYRDSHPDYFQRIVPAMENMTDVTLLIKTENAGNAAIQRVYSDCVIYENAAAVVIAAPSCRGRLGALEREFERIRGGTA